MPFPGGPIGQLSHSVSLLLAFPYTNNDETVSNGVVNAVRPTTVRSCCVVIFQLLLLRNPLITHRPQHESNLCEGHAIAMKPGLHEISGDTTTSRDLGEIFGGTSGIVQTLWIFVHLCSAQMTCAPQYHVPTETKSDCDYLVELWLTG